MSQVEAAASARYRTAAARRWHGIYPSMARHLPVMARHLPVMARLDRAIGGGVPGMALILEVKVLYGPASRNR